MANVDAPAYQRYWLLCLIGGAERAGQCPVSLRDLNALVYLANATLPCYDIESLDATVRKSGDGPLYPKVIWDLDRLVGMLLVKVSGLVVETGLPSAGHYSATREGLATIAKGKALHSDFARLVEAQFSIALAYARFPECFRPRSLLERDANYAEHHIGVGDVVDFGEWEHTNWTSEAVSKMTSYVAERVVPGGSVIPEGSSLHQFVNNPGLAVALYATYLATEASEGSPSVD